MSDAELLEQFYAGSDEAFANLQRRYLPLLEAELERAVRGPVRGRRQVAEEAASSAMWRVYGSRRTGAAWRRGQSSVRTWLLLIARRELCSCLRTQSARQWRDVRAASELAPARCEDDVSWLEGSLPAPAGLPDEGAYRSAIHHALRTLPDDEYSVVAATVANRLSQSELARRLGLSEATISRRLLSARRRLARRL